MITFKFFKFVTILIVTTNCLVECYDQPLEINVKPKPPPCNEDNCKNGVCLKNNLCECNKDYRTSFKIGHIEHCNERIEISSKEKCSTRNCVNGLCITNEQCQCYSGFAESPSMDANITVCEKISDITGTVISLVFGIPLCLSTIGLIVFCIWRRKANSWHMNSVKSDGR